ncbi:guanine deaminase [Microcystis phage MaAM05]|nr:guanine deaminase [Microcystis phage MaAM05]
MHALGKDELAYFADGALLVDAEGVITACAPWDALRENLEGVAVTRCLPHQLIVPGFVDTHVHLPQMAVAGRQAPSLLEWLDTHIFAEEARFADTDYARAVSEWFLSELLANGTTLANIFLTSHPGASQIAFETAARLGNRVVMGQTLMDKHAPDSLLRPTAQLLAETESLCKQWHGANDGRIQYAWVPRFALTSSEALMSGLGTLRRQFPDVYLHTHLSEQLAEIAAVKAQFPWAHDYTQVYERFGLLGSRTILAHGIHLCDEELDRLKALDASLAHCPSSNFFLKSGRFRLMDVLQRQLRLGLGSDVGAGPALSLLTVMKDAQYMQADTLVPLATLFYLATLGGAEALHQGHRLGNFEPGKEADFVVLDLPVTPVSSRRPEVQPPQDSETLVSRLVYQGHQQWISETFIRGQRVYQRAAIVQD